MKYFIFALIITLCLFFCSCTHSPVNKAEGNDSTNATAPDTGDIDSTTDPNNETSEITLPNQWGTIELPEIDLEDPTSEETATAPPATVPPATEPPVETKGEEGTVSPVQTEDENDSGIITTPEDVFE